MESSLGKPSSGKGYEQVQKENRESDKDLHPFEYNFERGQLQLQHFTFVIYRS